VVDSKLSRKTSNEEDVYPYRNPTQVDGEHAPKAFERILFKELGKFAP